MGSVYSPQVVKGHEDGKTTFEVLDKVSSASPSSSLSRIQSFSILAGECELRGPHDIRPPKEQQIKLEP